MEINTWLQEIGIQLELLEKIDLGYPKIENEILPVATPELLDAISETFSAKLPEQFAQFYRNCGGLSLRNIHNGYFIVPLHIILKSAELSLPVKISGKNSGNVIPFGSTMGGEMFALRADTGQVVFIPEGLVENGVYYEKDDEIKVIANDFYGFLDRLMTDVKAFINRDEDWDYMV